MPSYKRPNVTTFGLLYLWGNICPPPSNEKRHFFVGNDAFELLVVN